MGIGLTFLPSRSGVLSLELQTGTTPTGQEVHDVKNDLFIRLASLLPDALTQSLKPGEQRFPVIPLSQQQLNFFPQPPQRLVSSKRLQQPVRAIHSGSLSSSFNPLPLAARIFQSALIVSE